MAHRLRAEVVGDAVLVKLDYKRLDDSNIWDVEEQLVRLAAERDPPRLWLDLAGLEHLSSLSLGKFLALHKRLRALGGQLRLVNVGPRVNRLLERTKLANVLNIQPSGEAGPQDVD
jgi:anti-sigma B factor antagonist